MDVGYCETVKELDMFGLAAVFYKALSGKDLVNQDHLQEARLVNSNDLAIAQQELKKLNIQHKASVTMASVISLIEAGFEELFDGDGDEEDVEAAVKDLMK